MWFTLDDDDEFVLRRASLEPLAGRRGEEGVRGR
jgi:hypothetical protein